MVENGDRRHRVPKMNKLLFALLFALCDFGHGWVPASLLFQRRVSLQEKITSKINPFFKRKSFIQFVTMFGEEVKEEKTPYPGEKFSTKEEENAYILNNTMDFDTSKLPEINLEEELQKQKEMRTYMGEKDGMDDPRDAPWRLKAENIIRNCIKQESKVALYDITWNIADLNIVIEALDGGVPIDLDMITSTSKALEAALNHFEDELDIFGRHELNVGSRGVSNHLKCERDYKTFKGFEVDVAICDFRGYESRDPVRGKLMEVSIHETIVTQKGRRVTIPNWCVENITLPPALYEPKDIDKKFRKRF